MKSTSSERFVKLANKRVNNAIHHIRLIGNLSNKSNYEYTEKQIKQIFAELQKETNHCEELFKIKFKSSPYNFELED